MCDGEPAPIQTTGCCRSDGSISACAIARCGNGATRAGLEPGRLDHLVTARATRTSVAPTAAATARSSARRSPGTSASTYAPSQTNTIDLTIWASSQPTARAASRAVGVPSANSSMRDSTPASRNTADTRSTGSGQAHFFQPIR